MGKKTGRIILDALLTIMIVFEMFIQYTGDFLHEVVGFAFFATVIVHLLLSAKWMKNTAHAAKSGKLTGRRTALAVMGILLAIAMVALGVSSVAISNLLSSTGFTWTLGSYAMWVVVHTISSYALCALVAVHLAMHWAFLFSAFKVPYNPARRQAISTGVHAVAAVGAVALGITAARELMPQATAQSNSSHSSSNGQFANASDNAQSSSSSAAPSSSSASSKKRGMKSNQSSSTERSTASTSTSTVSGTCTLCHKNCPLSNPKCNKPYQAGLI